MKRDVYVPEERFGVLKGLRRGDYVLAPVDVPSREPGDEYGARRYLSVEPAVVSAVIGSSVIVEPVPFEDLPDDAKDWMRSFASSRAALEAMGDGIGVRADLPPEDDIYTNARTP